MKSSGDPSPASSSTAVGSRSISCLRGVKPLFPSVRSSSQEDVALSRMRHYRQISEFSSRIRLKLPQHKPSRPQSTTRSRLDNAETVILSCRRHLHGHKAASKELIVRESAIKASIQELLQVGGHTHRRFGAGRKQFLEEEYLTREQVTRMLVKVRRDFKSAYRGIL